MKDIYEHKLVIDKKNADRLRRLENIVAFHTLMYLMLIGLVVTLYW